MKWEDKIEVSVILILALLIAFACISGCAGQPSFEREERIAIDAENWYLCKMAYSGSDRHIVSRHMHRRHRPHSPYEIQDDLRDNNCRMVLGQYWITL